MSTDAKNAEVLRRAMAQAKGDNLERANLQFQHYSTEQLSAPYGQSGKTGNEVWEYYQEERASWESANAFLESMLREKGL